MFVTRPRSFVLCLLKACGPAAIVRLIVAVVVVAFDGVFRRRTATHVREEILERVQPALTDADATTAPVTELLVRWTIAAFSHVAPRFEFRTGRHAVRFRSCAQLFAFQAATRVRARQIVALHECFGPAIAATAVRGVSRVARIRAVFEDFQATVTRAGRNLGLPCHVGEFTILRSV